jgi:benzoate transport
MATTRDRPIQAAATATWAGESTRWVAWLCWAAVALEGFDLVVLGSVTPALLDYQPWGLTPGRVGVIASYALVGMMIGALTVGTVTDLVGRRATVLLSVVWFSLFTGLCAAAPSPGAFGLLRFLAGLGLGGVLPTAMALSSEYAEKRRGSAAVTFMMTGYHVGGVLTALLAVVVLAPLGWRAMFVLGALPALVLVPLMLRRLPESPSFLAARGRREEAEALSASYGVRLEEPSAAPASSGGRLQGLKTLFTGGYAPATLAFAVASFMGLVLVYGLNQWLPVIMREAGYQLGAALTFLLVLNLGAVLGLIFAGRVADRFGTKRVNILWFALASAFLFVLSVKLPLALSYLVVLLAGVFVFSAQVLVYAYVTRYYPAEARATSIGWASGIGRLGAITGPIVGGFLVGAGVAVPWGFYAFAATGLAALLAVLLVPRAPSGAT